MPVQTEEVYVETLKCFDKDLGKRTRFGWINTKDIFFEKFFMTFVFWNRAAWWGWNLFKIFQTNTERQRLFKSKKGAWKGNCNWRKFTEKR